MLYRTRLGNLADCLGIVWFLTAHILVYTSVKTCRFAAPHLWWLSFSILCILYFMILEVFLVGLVVFIFWPVFYVRAVRLHLGHYADYLESVAHLEYIPPLYWQTSSTANTSQARDRKTIEIRRRSDSSCSVHPHPSGRRRLR